MTTNISPDLKAKWDRYEATQHDKIQQRHKLAKKIALFWAICALGMAGSAAARSKENGARVATAATFALAAGATVLAQKPLDNKTFKRLEQERKNWFGR